MKFHHDFYLILFVFFVRHAMAKKKKLEIISTFKPEHCSETAGNGDMVSVHYVGKLENGQIFDASKEDPIKFKLGEGRVIKGWEKGISGMCVGEKRKLVIPPDLAYGANGVQGAIPPHATLTFETQLVGLEKDSSNGPFNIGKFLNFAIWPGMIVGVLFFLYKRMTAAEEKIKSEKKMRKKKR